MKLITTSAQQTQKLGYKLGEKIASLKPITYPICLILRGELGVGKTCLAQGIMRGLGVQQAYLTSPSYTLINQYPSSGGVVFHCDFYRLTSAEQAAELGWDECLQQGVVLIEWPEKVMPCLYQAGFLHIILTRRGEKKRQIELIPEGDKYRQLMKQLDLAAIKKDKENA